MPVHESLSEQDIGLYGASGRVTGLSTPFTFCLSSDKILAPSFLTDGGKSKAAGVKLWANIVLHVFATIFVCVANGAYFMNNSDEIRVLHAMASCAIAFQLLAVLGTLVATAFFFRAGTYPFINGFGIACFLFAILSNALAYVIHFIAHINSEINFALTNTDSNSSSYQPNVEEVNFPISLFFQIWAFGSVLANAIALGRQRQVDEEM